MSGRRLGLCAQDWTQWRGPTQDGEIRFTEPKAWPEKLINKWKVPVGEGYASPRLQAVVFAIVGHFADEEQSGWDRRLANAYDLRSYREAKNALLRIQEEFHPRQPERGA